METVNHKDGKTITCKNGVTTITKTVGGKQTIKTINNRGGVTMQFGKHGTPKGNTATQVHSSGGMRSGVTGIPSMGIVPTSNCRTTNQINITSSHINNMAIANKGSTVFQNQVQDFKPGAKNTELSIHGGNFSQANIAGEATYNNRGSSIGGGGGGLGYGKPPGKIYTIDDIFPDSSVAEQRVLCILKSGITSQQFRALLRKEFTIEKIENALSHNPGSPEKMVQSMLEYDGDNDSD